MGQRLPCGTIAKQITSFTATTLLEMEERRDATFGTTLKAADASRTLFSKVDFQPGSLRNYGSVILCAVPLQYTQNIIFVHTIILRHDSVLLYKV